MSLFFLGKRVWRWAAAMLLPAAPLCVATALAQSAPPAPAPPSSDSPAQPPDAAAIVVTGMSEREQLEVIRDYVRDLSIAVSYDPLARYEPGSYCPAVLGLSVARNGEIATRMRAVAKAAGVQPAAPGCRTSALVFFVENKAAFLAAFRKRHPIFFNDLRREYGAFPPREKGPASAWQLVGKLDPQGMPIGRPTNLGPTVVGSSMRGSRLLSMVTQVVSMSVVIVERDALVGLTATQIADYVAMRSLSDRGLTASSVPGQFTILAALTAPMGSAVPLSLTRWDIAYLKGRYAGDPARYGPSQRATIQKRMRAAGKPDKGK